MRAVLIAVAAVVVLSSQASAQMRARPTTDAPAGAPADPDRAKRMAREEAAARAAMKNIPDSKEKYDPWKIGK